LEGNLFLFSLALEYARISVMAKRKNPAAVSLGKRGGKKRAETRGWEKIPSERRVEMAQKAIRTRWSKAKQAVKGNS
jgi:hypothetical protein